LTKAPSRSLKRRLQPRYPAVAYIPDRFLVVVLSAVFTWRFGWDLMGLEILGDVKSTTGAPFPFHWPFKFAHMRHIQTAMSTSFLIALLGFFESSVAAKSLGEGTHELQGVSLSANRELVALGVANLIGGCFMALPAFGGYGRSKVNSSTGGTTPMSSIFLSVITIICILFLLPYFYYLPKAVLSSMISVVAYSLVEECPHDIKFFWRIRGWTELSLMTIIFLATIFYSLSLGIALGIGLSILALIRHSTKARIQILGKVPGSHDKFENAEIEPERLEFIEGCLICKIPEPLTFANTGELKTRLRRLEYYGTNAAHPALPRVRAEEHNRNVIFDVHGVTGIDGSGTQVLTEIVESYVKRGVRVFFCRLPTRRSNSKVFRTFLRSGIVELVGGQDHFVNSVEEALRLSEQESLTEYFDNRMDGI
jgi:MFS superfamily sulfate permease-like transporter